MLNKITFGALATCLLAAVGAAQSFNIDIIADPSNPSLPPPTYGGLAGPAGPWNPVQVTSTLQPLTTVQGVPDNSNAWFTGAAFPAQDPTFNNPPHNELYRDFAAVGTDPGQFHVNNLTAGPYALVVYSFYPNVKTQFTLNSTGGTTQVQTVNCPGVFPGLVNGLSLTQFAFTIPAGGGSITIDFIDAGGDEGGVMNGVQLATNIGTSGCPQPINSVFAFPKIVPSGTLDPTGTGYVAAANDIQLSVGLLPASNTAGIGAILCFVANDNSVVFPQTCPAVGSRCIGNPTVVRVWDPNAGPGSGGVGQTTASGTYNLPIDLPSLGALGVNVSPGASLHFQMIYRDNNNTPPVSCPTDPSLKRWTESLSIQLF